MHKNPILGVDVLCINKFDLNVPLGVFDFHSWYDKLLGCVSNRM